MLMFNKEIVFKSMFRIITIIVTLLLILFVIYGLKLGIFQDKTVLVDYIKEFGVVAPLFFILYSNAHIFDSSVSFLSSIICSRSNK